MAKVGQLERALASRVVIEQAKGVLVARDGIAADLAFERLRGQARSTRRKLADLAREVVERAPVDRAKAIQRAKDVADRGSSGQEEPLG
jgi:AmiR/NasT family two-component response regulator